MRKELLWDRDEKGATPDIEIERAINFGGFDFIQELQKKYGLRKFKSILLNNRNLRKKAVNFWCLRLGIDRAKTAAYRNPPVVWSPFL